MAKALSRKEILATWFEHAGYKIFEEELKELQRCHQANAEAQLGEMLGFEGAAKLNFLAGKNRGSKEVLGLLESLKEETTEGE